MISQVWFVTSQRVWRLIMVQFYSALRKNVCYLSIYLDINIDIHIFWKFQAQVREFQVCIKFVKGIFNANDRHSMEKKETRASI